MKIDRTGAKVVGLVLGLFLFLGPLCGSANAECECVYYSTPEIEVSITSPPETENVCCVNEEVAFTCEASDEDTKCQYDPNCEGVADTVTCTWSKTGGSWKEKEGPDNQGQSVTWIAPATAGTYTITVTVDDEDNCGGGGCGGDICGSDDDDPKDKSLDILVIDGLTVVPREAYVCVNGTKNFQAWACVGGSIEEVTEDATFSTSKGSMGPGGGPGNNTLTASSTPSASEGADWVRATYGEQTTDAEHDCDLTVVQITESASPEPDANRKLWWFNGEDAQNYAEQMTLTVEPVTTGTFVWTVTSGTDKVDFGNDSDTQTKVNDNTVTVKSTAASDVPDDVGISVAISGKGGCTHTLTVNAPGDCIVRDVSPNPYDRAWGIGFKTAYFLRIIDTNKHPLPASLEFNESFGAWSSDYQGENWPDPEPLWAWTGATGNLEDVYGAQGGYPSAVNPGDPGDGTKVQHAWQFYRAGSLTIGQGLLIKTHILQFYRGRARQE